MQLFYLKHPNEEIILSPEESKHATKVLRKKKGDILKFTDGKGYLYKAKIIDSNSKKCRLILLEKQKKNRQHNYYLHIAIAPTKNIDRFEWFLEKVTEMSGIL